MNNTRNLNKDEQAILATGEGIPVYLPLHDNITCYGDTGYGPCGTYLDWIDGLCAEGHHIMVMETKS